MTRRPGLEIQGSQPHSPLSGSQTSHLWLSGSGPVRVPVGRSSLSEDGLWASVTSSSLQVVFPCRGLGAPCQPAPGLLLGGRSCHGEFRQGLGLVGVCGKGSG